MLLIAPLSLLFLVQSKIGFGPLVTLGVSSAVLACVATVAVDSIFWRRLLWPEAEVLYFNTILNKSGDYGTSPFYWYFSSALPRALLLAYPLALASFYWTPRARQLVAVPLLFVAVYSALPHKELRFVLYVVPPLNVAAATSLAKLYRAFPKPTAPSYTQRVLGRLGRLNVVAALLGCLALSGGFAAASVGNYPGAEALLALHELHGASRPRGSGRAQRPIHVHVGVAAAISGVSRFLEQPPPWKYSKTENLQPSDYRANGYAYALVDATEELPGFSTLKQVHGFAGIQRSSPYFRYEPKIKIVKRQAERTAGTKGDDAEFNF